MATDSTKTPLSRPGDFNDWDPTDYRDLVPTTGAFVGAMSIDVAHNVRRGVLQLKHVQKARTALGLKLHAGEAHGAGDHDGIKTTHGPVTPAGGGLDNL